MNKKRKGPMSFLLAVILCVSMLMPASGVLADEITNDVSTVSTVDQTSETAESSDDVTDQAEVQSESTEETQTESGSVQTEEEAAAAETVTSSSSEQSAANETEAEAEAETEAEAAAETETEAEIQTASATEGEIETTEASETKSATILYTNDVHTYINNTSSVNGETKNIIRYSTVAGYRDQLEGEGKNVLLVDAGDHAQGTAYGGLDKGESVIKIMNAAGYDLATVGNHEFDYDMDGFENIVSWANFPYISCNFYKINEDGSTTNRFDSYKMFTVDGINIAFVGITTPESISKSTPAYFQDDEGNYIYGIAGGADGTALYEAVQKAVTEAREAGADVVIALGHLGVDEGSKPWTSEEVIANTTGIDAFIDGHSHTTMAGNYVSDKDGNQVLLTQTGYYLSALGEMTITVDESGKATISTALLTAEDLADVVANETVAAAEEAWIASVTEQLGDVIAESDVNLYAGVSDWLVRQQETNLGDLNADAYYWYANEVASLDCDLAIMNGGGIRANVTAGTDWTYETCKGINPFGNVLCVAEVSGQDILDMLEYSTRHAESEAEGGFMQVAGVTFSVDTSIENTIQENDEGWVSGPSEYRVYDVMIYNKETGAYEALDLTATYRIAGTNYTLINCGGGFTMFSDSKLVLDGISEDYLAIAEYVKAFTDTDGDNLPNVSSAASPLTAYSGYVINYEDMNGSGRITIAEGKAAEPTVTPEPTVTVTPTATPEPTVTETPTAAPEPTVTAAPTVAAAPTTTAAASAANAKTSTTAASTAKAANTGDETNAALYIALIAIAAVGAGYAGRRASKRNK